MGKLATHVRVIMGGQAELELLNLKTRITSASSLLSLFIVHLD